MKNRFIFIISLLLYINILSQNIDCEFDNLFKQINNPLLLDDIAIKYSEKKTINYDLIKQNIRDSSGKVLIAINNYNHHTFYAICKKEISPELKYYLISHKVKINNRYDNYAYLVVYFKERLTSFKTVYVNTNSILYEENFGSVFIDNKYFCFYKNFENENFKITNSGKVMINDNYLKIHNLYFERISKYKINFDTSFYKKDKVLLPIIFFKKRKLVQLLFTVSKKKYNLQNSYYIDFIKNDFYYLNDLKNINDEDDKAYEVIISRYNKNNWLNNKSISEYFTLSDKQFVTKFILH